MNPLSCPYFDRLGRDLIDAYGRVDDCAIFCVLSGREVPNEIGAIHLEMAEHRRNCPLCRRIDYVRPGFKQASDALKEVAQTVH